MNTKLYNKRSITVSLFGQDLFAMLKPISRVTKHTQRGFVVPSEFITDD